MEGVVGVIDQVEVWFQQAEKITVKRLRKHVESIFMSILMTTPQGSGKAVANWKLGINAPDMTHEDDVGDAPEIHERKDGSGSYAAWAHRHTGDWKWVEYAWLEQKYKIAKIRVGDTVFFTNNVQGDTDRGASDTNYLASLQDPAYWTEKLRAVNQPYVTPAEVMLIHQEGWDTYADFGGTYIEEFL